LLVIGAAALATPGAHAELPVIRPQQRLPMPPQDAPRPTNPRGFGQFALSDGETIIVTVPEGRAAYAYVKDSSGRWIYDSALVAPPSAVLLVGGAIRGRVAVMQGFDFDTFASTVYVFVRSGGQWAITQTLPGVESNHRANRLALGADYLAVGDILANDSAGVLRIYDEVSIGQYSFATDLSMTGSGQGYLVGYHVLADGDTVLAASAGGQVVGAFARSGGVWAEQAVLIPDQALSLWFFAFSGSRAFLTTQQNPQEFVRRDGTWLKRGMLNHPSDLQRSLMNPIAMDGRRVIVGEEGSEDAMLFELRDGEWTATAVLRNANDQSCPRTIDSGSITLVGRLALAACDSVPTPDHDFEGRVLVYELPPLASSGAGD
jgi:hypothetical protein